MPKPESDPLQTVQNAPGCPRNDRRPTAYSGEPDPAATTFDLSELFPGANRPCVKDGLTSVDLWRQQDRADEQRRQDLIAEYHRQEAAREAARDQEILFTPRPIGRR